MTDEDGVYFRNTKLDAIRYCYILKTIGKKIWFISKYCELTKKNPQLKQYIDDIIANNIEFSVYVSSKYSNVATHGGYCYARTGSYGVKAMNLSPEQQETIKLWYRRIRDRKDSAVVDDYIKKNSGFRSGI